MPIKVLDKPPLTPCQNLVDPLKDCKNCTIYEDRPEPCQTYACLWIAGHGNEEDRPDLCDVLIDSMMSADNAFRGVPLSKGAQDTKRGLAAVNRFSKSLDAPILVCEFGETKLLRVVGRGI
jgi:hypothetical protein